MRYRLEFGEAARKQLRECSTDLRRRIGQKLDALQTDLAGDVKKLAGQAGKYRLRVGNVRILFALENDLIYVHQLKDRKDAYRD